MRLKNKNLVLAGFLILAVSAIGQTYYIDALNGSDLTGYGTEQSPYQSLDSVWNKLKGGETIRLNNGHYGSIYQNNYQSPISLNDYVVVEAAEGASPQLDSVLYVGFESGDDKTGTHNAYMHFKGIHFLNGLVFYGVRDILIENCLIERFGPWTGSDYDIEKTAISFTDVSNFTIKDCEITNTGTAIGGRGENIKVLNTEIHHITHDGIRVAGWRNSLVEGNLIYNLDDGVDDEDADWSRHCDAIHVFIGGANSAEELIVNNNVVFRSNVIYDSESQGLQFNNYYVFPKVHNTNLVFENNIFGPTRANRFNCGGDAVDNLVFRNNTYIPVEEGHTFTSPFRTLLCDNNVFRVEPDIAGLEVYNNILPNLPNVSDTQYCDYNLYYNALPNSAISMNSIIDTNIHFENKNNLDGKLLATSPAINSGTRINAPSGVYELDFYSTIRDERPDMGAYELPEQTPEVEQAPPVFDDDKFIFIDDFTDANFRLDPWLQAENTQGLSWEQASKVNNVYSVINQADFDGNCLSGPGPDGKAWILSERGADWADYSFEFDAYNAYVTENDGPVFLVKDTNNCYWLDISRDKGRLVRFMQVNNELLVDTIAHSEDIRLPHVGVRAYRINITHSDNSITIEVDADKDGSVDLSYTEENTNAIDAFTCGKVGFHINHSNGYSRALYDNIRVEVSNFCELASGVYGHSVKIIDNVKIYPNPSSTKVRVQANSFKQAEIYTLNGHKLFTSPDAYFNISHIASGVYIVKVIHIDDSYSIVKLIVE